MLSLLRSVPLRGHGTCDVNEATESAWQLVYRTIVIDDR